MKYNQKALSSMWQRMPATSSDSLSKWWRPFYSWLRVVRNHRCTILGSNSSSKLSILWSLWSEWWVRLTRSERQPLSWHPGRRALSCIPSIILTHSNKITTQIMDNRPRCWGINFRNNSPRSHNRQCRLIREIVITHFSQKVHTRKGQHRRRLHKFQKMKIS